VEKEKHRWFATCPKGIEGQLAEELAGLGAVDCRQTVAGCFFNGPLAVAYRACLWSRLANRILAPIARVKVASADDLYQQLVAIEWSQWLTTKASFSIDFHGENREIRHTRFGAQRSKDAIMDWFKNHGGVRPRVNPGHSDIRLNLQLRKTRLDVALDLSGGSLHRRGYRHSAGKAPLKENLAAALLLRAGWPEVAAAGGALIDPMCGSATLLLEAAMMAADVAPALNRDRFGFEHWPGHQPQQWQAILSDAKTRAQTGMAKELPEIRGYDDNAAVVRRAQENIAEAGFSRQVRVSVKPLAELKKPTHRPMENGLLISNPPYGQRLGDKDSLKFLYAELGRLASAEFAGWQAAFVTPDLELGKAIGLRSHKQYRFFNGTLSVTLLLFELDDNEYRPPASGNAASQTDTGHQQLSAGAEMFANRLRKNRRRLAKWLTQTGVGCYRLYDADMPEYAVAVDVYQDRVHVAEYQPPKDVDEASATKRLQEVLSVVGMELKPVGDIALKQRRRQRGKSQYQKSDRRGELISVTEGQAKLLVNLYDYLDTGLFLDHRPLRRIVAERARGKRFLNLFCYTGAATVQAALGGAKNTTSVDMSNTYLDWLRKNLAHNGLGESRHSVVRADCLTWLTEHDQNYDLIMLDPPSFSNSSRMEGTLDIQRDHVQLIVLTMARLNPGGELYFSTNRRGFGLDEQIMQRFQCVDISTQTLDPDFARNPGIHRCWKIQPI